MKKRKLIAELMLFIAPLALSACSSKPMTKAQMEDSVAKASKNVKSGSLDEGLKMNLIGIPVNMEIKGDFIAKPAQMAGTVSAYTPHGKKNGKMPFIIKDGVAKTKDHGKWETTDTSNFSAKDYKKPLNMIDKENFRKTAKYQQKDGLVHMNMKLNAKQRKEVLKVMLKTAKDKDTKNMYKGMDVDQVHVTETVDPKTNTIQDVKENMSMSSLLLHYKIKLHMNNVNKISKVEAK